MMSSLVRGFPAPVAVTFLFINHICALLRACRADARSPYLSQETHLLRPPAPTGMTGETGHASYIFRSPHVEAGMLSGGRERRLGVGGKEVLQFVSAVGNEIPTRSPELASGIEKPPSTSVPDTEASTTTTSSLETYGDRRSETGTLLRGKKLRGEGGHRRIQRPKVKLNVHLNYGSHFPPSNTQRRAPEGYSRGWRAFWSAGAVIGTGLVASACGSGLDYEFIDKIENNAGACPEGGTSADRAKYGALARLSFGIYILLITGISYLIRRYLPSNRRAPNASTSEEFS